MKHLLRMISVGSLVLIVGVVPVWNENSQYLGSLSKYVKENYTQQDHMIPMRDGKRLFTTVYIPRDTTQEYPIILTRTPYKTNTYINPIGMGRDFAREGYIFVYQDVRGRYQSEGDFVNVRPHKPVKKGSDDIDESTDTYDTIEWLINNIPGNNGRVGLWGISYLGFYTTHGMIDAHPALKAASPQAPVTDWFIGDDFHHNGAFFLTDAFSFISSFGVPRPKPTTKHAPRFDFKMPDGYKFFLELGPIRNANEKYFKKGIPFWNDLMEHGTYDDFWKARDPLQYLKNVRPAVMTVAGWFDAEDLWGTLAVYRTVEKHNPGIFNILVMGPWAHAGWAFFSGSGLGDLRFGSKTSLFYQKNIALPFFNYYLKDKGELDLPEAYVFETGTNQWRQFESWPPKGTADKPLYFRKEGRLSFEPPAQQKEVVFDEYLSDPSRPVPYIGRLQIGRSGAEYMVADQRFAATRPDVLVYQTDILTEDLTIAGPIAARLCVSTSGTDSDWVVKLIDVYPDDYPDNKPNPLRVRMGGYQQLVRAEIMRGKFRNSFENPEPFVPNEPTKVEFVLPDTLHTFRQGHRIMVQIQSSWFPLVDRNPQKFVDIYKATASDFQKATQRLYRTGEKISSIALTVLPKVPKQ
jgi:putative CocE/NonD family hydrolase